MHPVLLKIGLFHIYSYGVMVALGFAVATFCIYRRAPKFNLERDKVIDVVIIMLVTGIIGARTLYVLLNLDYYHAHPYEILNLSKGGLVWYGAFIPALLASMLYAWRERIKFWPASDLVAPYIALAQSFGRIGCFLNGCCYGVAAPPGYPLAVTFSHDCVTRHPAQIYSAVALFIIFIILLKWQEREHCEGEIFLGYLVLYPGKRFFMEFLRGDNPKILFGLTFSQYVSLLVLSASLIMLIKRAVRWKKRLIHSK